MAATRKALLEQRAKVIKAARDINDKYADEDGNLPAEHQQAFDKAMDDAEKLKASADRVGRLEDGESGLGARDDDHGVTPPNPGASGAKGGDGVTASVKIALRSYERDAHGRPKYELVPAGDRGQQAYRDAFAKALKFGVNSLSSEQFAALQSDSSEDGGYLNASEQFAAGLLQDVDNLVFVRQHATVHPVPEADALGIRKRTARLSTWRRGSELGAPTPDTSLKFGKKVLTPSYLSGEAKISRDLLRRSSMGVETIVRSEMSRDLAEVLEAEYLTGDGVEKGLGVFVASADGISTARDVNTGSAAGVTADGLIAGKYSLKQAYRTGGVRAGCRWLFHRDAIKLISQLKDGDNHYMLQPARGLTGDEWDTLLGYPVDESELAPNTFTNGLYFGILAQWRYYEIADALDMEMSVLDQLYIRENQTGFLGRVKTDSLPTLEEAFVRLKCAA